MPWAGVVLDEAQNIKNPETKQAKAARSLPADYRIALTGTPVENNVGDLWSIMEFLNPGFSGTQAEFKRQLLPAHPGWTATREAADAAEAADRPVHPAPAQDRPSDHHRPAREAGDEGLLHPDQGAGLALRGGGRRRRARRSRKPRASSARG